MTTKPCQQTLCKSTSIQHMKGFLYYVNNFHRIMYKHVIILFVLSFPKIFSIIFYVEIFVFDYLNNIYLFLVGILRDFIFHVVLPDIE